jgi:hypothetical protein
MLVMLNVESLNLKLSKATHWQGQKRQKQKIWQKWKARKKRKIRKIIPGGVGSMTETRIWISQKPGTLFIPRLSVKLHLKVWNNFYSYTNASPEK